ncbi:hypothetical protein JCM10213_006529 [Rhodosporidiobolus nylandii]
MRCQPASQGPYADSYSSYDYPPSTSSTPALDYPPPHHTAQHIPPSYSSSHGSRSRSASAAESGTPALASTFVLPSSVNVSPSSVYGQQLPHPPNPQPSSTLLSGQNSGQTIYRDRFAGSQARSASSSHPSGLVTGPAPWGEAPLGSPVDAHASYDFSSAAPSPALRAAPLTRATSTGKGKATKATKNAAPRKRVPASCKPCRAKKLRCDRALPCGSCVERGHPQDCIWEGDAQPLYVARGDNDAKELKAQVDRLQHLLDALSQQTPSLPSGSGRETSRSSTVRRAKRSSSTLREYSADEDGEEPTFDLSAQDLCTSLSELALNSAMSAQLGQEAFVPGRGSGESFVAEARQFILAFAQDHGQDADFPFQLLAPGSSPTASAPDSQMRHSQPPSATSSSFRASPSALGLSAALLNSRPSVSQILDLLPSEAELRATYKFYVNHVHWYSNPLDLAAIDRGWPAFSAALAETDPAKRDAAVDPLYIAIVMAACASGLASMTAQQATRAGFPENRSCIVDSWTRTTMLAMTTGRFFEAPSMEGIRAALVLSSLYVEQFMTSGETVSAGMSLLSLAVNAAFAMNLQRDPVQKGKTTFTFAECEDRRRIFWCLFSLCMSITTGTSRTWLQFDLRQIDCKFPLDCYDAELLMDERAAKARIRGRVKGGGFEETPMTSAVVRAQYSLLVKKITDVAFSVKPCRYGNILSLDAELRAFEESFPPCYNLPVDNQGRIRFTVPPSLTEMRCALIQLSLCAEFVRLHRPFLVLAATDEQYQYSREVCVKYAKRMLAINAMPACNLHWAGHNFKVLSAAITLCIELLQSPTESDAPLIRSTVDASLHQAEGFAAVSSVCRNAAGLVRFLLNKLDEEASTLPQPRRAKRARTLIYDPDDSNGRFLADALGGFSATSSRAPSPSLRRKPIRPPLPHVQSDTVVAQVQGASSADTFAAAMSTPDDSGPHLRPGSRAHSTDTAFPTLGSLAASASQQFAQPVSLNSPPSYPSRPIAGMRHRASAQSVGGSAGFNQHLSSPEFVAPLSAQSPQQHLGQQQPSHHIPGLQLPPEAFMHAHHYAASNAPLSSSSLFDEHDVQSFFSLPAQIAGAEQGEGGGRNTPLAGGVGMNMQQEERSRRSRFNDPLDEQYY